MSAGINHCFRKLRKASRALQEVQLKQGTHSSLPVEILRSFPVSIVSRTSNIHSRNQTKINIKLGHTVKKSHYHL